MSLRISSAGRRRAAMICRIVGLCIFVLAFFLPAWSDSPGAGSQGSGLVLRGWQCAVAALAGTPGIFERPDLTLVYLEGFLTVMSGWITPLIVAVLALSFSPKFRNPRRVLAGVIVLCLIATWLDFHLARFFPLIGCYVWVAGALLVIAPEVFSEASTTAAEEDPLSPIA